MGWKKGQDGPWQKEVELCDIKKGKIPGIMTSVLKSPQGVMGLRDQTL